MKKRIFAIILSVLLITTAFSLFGCTKEEETYQIKYVLDYQYAQYSKDGVKYYNSYTKVNGKKELATKRLRKGRPLSMAVKNLTPVVVDKNGEVVSSKDADFYFREWRYLLDGELYKITSDTKVGDEIAVDGIITIVAYCEATYIGPF